MSPDAGRLGFDLSVSTPRLGAARPALGVALGLGGPAVHTLGGLSRCRERRLLQHRGRGTGRGAHEPALVTRHTRAQLESQQVPGQSGRLAAPGCANTGPPPVSVPAGSGTGR